MTYVATIYHSQDRRAAKLDHQFVIHKTWAW